MSNEVGCLYVVATPIGNLGDLSVRAAQVLGSVDLIAAEDTRHSKVLLRLKGIDTPLISLHEHNENARCEALVARLLGGQSVALISDAGTPLMSDPGYRLVRAALEQGIQASPIPGPSAIIAALSVSGLPTDRFVFEGFLPARAGPRRMRLETLCREPRTLVFFESCHRIAAALSDLADIFGTNRPAALARELTKVYESVRQATLGVLRDWVSTNPEQRKGEIALVVAGDAEAGRAADDDGHLRQVLMTLLDELPVKQAAHLAARLTKTGRNRAYKLAIELQSKDKP